MMRRATWPEADPEGVKRAEHALAMMRVGEEIRRLREESPLTLRGLAAILGVSAPFLSDVEHGRRALAPGRLPVVAKALGCTVTHLVGIAGVCSHCMGTGHEPRKTR